MKIPTTGQLFPASALTLAIAAASTPAPLLAQDGIEEVTVTAIRKSLAEAVDRKRESTQFMDAIMADDMGKLPDANVAESLQRVSGVQVDRGIGEGSDISVRGLRQNVILVNGRQIIEAGGRGSRGPDTLESSSYGLLSLIPSKLVSSLEVSKQSSSEQIEGALGGVVNIVTHKPLDQPGSRMLGSVTGSHTELSGDNGIEWFGLYSNTFNDDTLGFQISATQSKREIQEDGMNTFSGYGLLGEGDGLVDVDNNGDGVPGLVHRDMRFQQINDQREKTGLNAIVQWMPSDGLELYADSFYSEVTSDRERYWTGFWNCCSFTNPVFSDNDVLMSADVVRPVQTNTEFADAEASFISNALGGKWNGESLSISTEVSATDSESTLVQDFIRYQTAAAVPVSFDLSAGDVPSVDFHGTDLNDIAGLNLAILYDNLFERETSDVATRVDFEWAFDSGAFSSVEWGARYNQMETDVNIRQVDIRPNFALTDIPDISTGYSNPDFFSGDAGAIPTSYLVADRSLWQGCETLADVYDAAQQAECNKGRDPLGSYQVDEDIVALYAKANFDTLVGNMGLSGNFGLRHVSRDLTSTGNFIDGDTITPRTSTKNDSELLPSAVVKLDLSEELVLRLGAARALAFPNTNDLNNGMRIKGDNTGESGSPELDPFIANQMDISAEWYFAAESIASAGFFYKDVEFFIVESIQAQDIPGYPDPITISQKINGEGGSIRGLELLYQQPFTFLPRGWDGMGVMATYSYIDSETPFQDINGNKLPMPGLSENNVNLVLYYEADSYGVRLAYNWRDAYLDGIGNGDTGIYYNDYADLAATANWQINDFLSLNLEAVNLLDTRQEQYNAFEEATRRNVEFGRVFKLTLGANF